MRGIAIIDCRPAGHGMAVWCTSRSPRLPTLAVNVNAHSIEVGASDDSREIVRSLTRCRAVLATDGSDLEGLPIEGRALRPNDLVDFASEIEERRCAILAAIDDADARNGTKLVRPDFAELPTPDRFEPTEDAPVPRAFALAEHLRALWIAWLLTDTERQRRVGRTSLAMPPELSDPEVPDFPDGFAARLIEQPLV